MANTAALIQIMSVGKQNKILNAEPQITFWRFTHMRYTDFALEQVRVTSNGSNVSLQATAGTHHFDLPRAGDLCRNAFVVYHLPGLVNVTTAPVTAANVTDDTTLEGTSRHWTGTSLDHDDTNALASFREANITGPTMIAPKNTDGEAEFVEDALERVKIFNKGSAQTLALVAGPQPYWINNIGQYLTNEIRLQVGSQVVDTVYDHFLKAWDELSDKPGRVLSSNYGEMTMNGSAAQRKQWSRKRRSVFVPVPMFFSRTSGNSMPLIALSFHGVKFVLKTSSFSKCVMNYNPEDTSASGGSKAAKTYVRKGQAASHQRENSDSDILFHGTKDARGSELKASDIKIDMQVGFVYLGIAEREKFAEASYDILIDQVQRNEQPLNFNGSKKTLNNIGFNHCVQEIVWVVTHDSTDPLREPMNYDGPLGSDGQPRRPVVGVQLRLNNSKRLTHLDGEEVPGDYFCQLDPYLHHTRVPTNVYAYSWAITPEGTQPSGACNFSRIDHASFEIRTRDLDGSTLSNPTLHLYARNWNVFRVSLGLGGLKWAS